MGIPAIVPNDKARIYKNEYPDNTIREAERAAKLFRNTTKCSINAVRMANKGMANTNVSPVAIKSTRAKINNNKEIPKSISKG